MFVITNESKTKAYLDELNNLVSRAAADGILITVTGGGKTVDPKIDELVNHEDNFNFRVVKLEEIVNTPELSHLACSYLSIAVKENVYRNFEYGGANSSSVSYTYVNKPEENHPLPEPIDYSRYYKRDPNHPVNWMDPAITAAAADMTDFKITKECCDVNDKFCSTDEWKGNLHAVVARAVFMLIDNGKLKYIGRK